MSYAVIELSGSQFLVSEGDRLKIDRLPGKEGKKISLVPLLVSSDNSVRIGTSLVKDIKVQLSILEHRKDKKIEVRRFRSKSRYRRNRGHRQPISIVEITKISAVKPGKEKSQVLRPVPKPGFGESAAGELDNLKLSTRTKNALEAAGVKSISQLKKMSQEELLKLKGIGDKAIEDLEKALDTKY